VTAVSGFIRQGIFKALQNTEYSLDGINIEALGSELHITKKHTAAYVKEKCF
jgi:hypothetical protein